VKTPRLVRGVFFCAASAPSNRFCRSCRRLRSFDLLFGPWVLGAYPLLWLGPLAVSLLQRVPFSNAGVPAQQKGTKRLGPRRTALRLGSVFPRYGVHPGASPTVCFAAPPLDVCGYAARRCAPAPDEHLRSACRWGRKSKARSKARSKAGAKADQKIAAFGSSYRSKWGGMAHSGKTFVAICSSNLHSRYV